MVVEEKRLKRGDVRGDGKIFWCYAKNSKDGEYWIPVDQFDYRMIAEKRWRKENYNKIKTRS